MRHSRLQILLGFLVLLNNACAILSFSPTESINTPSVEVHDKIESLSFSYIVENSKDLANDGRTLSWESQTIRNLFEHHSRFSKVIVTSTPPQNGMHVNVYQTDDPVSQWCRVSIWPLAIIPCYADGVVHTMHFDVFLNNTLEQSYEYKISRKGVQWLGLLPFWWVNLFTTQYKDAFAANAFQFVVDAKRNGYL